MATQGLTVFCNIYSTFLQRAYDQVIHDVAIQNLPVIFCLDRAGLVGEDGATHHGVFDIAFLRCIPNLIICAPRNEIELRDIMYSAQLGLKHPIAIRYPRGRGTIMDWRQPFSEVKIGKGAKLKEGKKLAVLSIGAIASSVSEAISKFEGKNAIAHYDMRFVKPLDSKLLHTIFKTYEEIITVEDGVISGGFGSAILEFAGLNAYSTPIKLLGIPDIFVEQASVNQQHQSVGIDVDSLTLLFTATLLRLE
jgi:1-deoxy-D-xylulose-5-phosphate synthase